MGRSWKRHLRLMARIPGSGKGGRTSPAGGFCLPIGDGSLLSFYAKHESPFERCYVVFSLLR